LQVIDFRPLKEYEKQSLPNSTSFTFDNLFEKEPNKILKIRHKINVFVAEDELTERKYAIIASKLGFSNVTILSGGLSQFTNDILNFDKKSVATNRQEVDTFRFRTKASEIIPIMIQENKSAGPVKKTQKRVVGGC
jgi:rhodanese-related sulfurtransferase